MTSGFETNEGRPGEAPAANTDSNLSTDAQRADGASPAKRSGGRRGPSTWRFAKGRPLPASGPRLGADDGDSAGAQVTGSPALHMGEPVTLGQSDNEALRNRDNAGASYPATPGLVCEPVADPDEQQLVGKDSPREVSRMRPAGPQRFGAPSDVRERHGGESEEKASLVNSLYFGNVDSAFPARDEWREVREDVNPYLASLGSIHNHLLGLAFERDDAPADVVKSHLARPEITLPRVLTDAVTVEVLTPYVERFVDHPVVESEALFGNNFDQIHTAGGMRIGDVALTFDDRGFTARKIERRPGDRTEEEYGVTTDDNGALLVVSYEQPLRFRATVDAQGRPRIYHERVLTLSQEEAAAFRQYGQDFRTYNNLFWQAIETSGYDTEPLKAMLQEPHRDVRAIDAALQEAGRVTAKYCETNPAPPAVEMMEMLAQLIMEERNQRSFTADGVKESMFRVGWKIRDYFQAINLEGIARQYHREQ